MAVCCASHLQCATANYRAWAAATVWHSQHPAWWRTTQYVAAHSSARSVRRVGRDRRNALGGHAENSVRMIGHFFELFKIQSPKCLTCIAWQVQDVIAMDTPKRTAPKQRSRWSATYVVDIIAPILPNAHREHRTVAAREPAASAEARSIFVV